MKYRFMNILIVFLFILALYQTYILWFVNLSNNSNTQNQLNVNPTIKENLVKPFRLSVEIEENKFNSYYSVDDLPLYTNGKSLFGSILRNGTNVDDFDKSGYTDLVVFNYNFYFEEEYFKDSLNESKSKVNINSFNNIFIYFKQDKNYAVFYNSENESSTIVSFGDKSYLTTLSNYKSNENLYFESEDLIHFKESWTSPLEYNEIIYSNPYSSNGEIHITSIENMINGFFRNPLSKAQSIQNETGAITFSDNNTIVRYYPNDILEYKYYDIYQENTKANFTNFFALAENFIKNDVAVSNNFYLDSYKIENEEIIFYFNYSIGDFPILLSENFKIEHDIRSFLEVTVKNNTIINYRKLTYSFQLSNDVKIGNLTYDEAIYGGEATTNNLLGYKMESTTPLTLYWFLYYDASEFTMPFTYN